MRVTICGHCWISSRNTSVRPGTSGTLDATEMRSSRSSGLVAWENERRAINGRTGTIGALPGQGPGYATVQTGTGGDCRNSFTPTLVMFRNHERTNGHH